MAAVWEALTHTWIPFIFSGYQQKLTIIMTKILRHESRKARVLIRLLAPIIRPSEMRQIIEGLVESSDLDTVRFCLEIYSQKSILCLTGALIHAINEGKEEMINLLLKYKVDYTSLENSQVPAIHFALMAKRLDVLEKLFKLGATLDNYKIWNYLSLRQAVRYTDKRFLSLLLKEGIPADSSNRMGSTVLGDAIARSDQGAVEILLEAGASMRKFQYLGQAANGPTEIFELLIQHAKKLEMPISSQHWLLERAASAPYINSLNNVQLLLDEGVPVNSRSHDGRYAIETAILQGNDHTLALLLDEGAEVEIPTRSGDGLLHIAAEFGTNNSIKFLLEKSNINVNKRDYAGNTALRLAYWNNNYIKVRTLAEAGAILYPPGELFRYVYPDRIPRFAISFFLPLLARENEEGRIVNNEDILTLENNYPEHYDNYIEACQEWQRMRNTYWTRRISYADLFEKSTTTLLRLSKQRLLPRHEGAFGIYQKFPIYGIGISKRLVQLLRKRAKWIGHEKRLQGITENQFPSLIIERVAYHLHSS